MVRRQSPDEESRRVYNKPCVVLTEGRDAERFIIALALHLDITTHVEVRDYGSVSELSSYLKNAAKVQGWSEVKSVGIIRDAEDDPAKSAFDSVCSRLSDNGYDAPSCIGATSDGSPRVSVFILPNQHDAGCLETLCWQAIGDDATKACVEQYLACLENTPAELAANRDKVRVHAYLTSWPKPALKLGEAANAGVFPWDSFVFEPLKQFLLDIARSDEP